MSKYIKSFQLIGVSTVDVDIIVKDWNAKFAILTWINDKEERYTFFIKGKKKIHRSLNQPFQKNRQWKSYQGLTLFTSKTTLLQVLALIIPKVLLRQRLEDCC